MQKLISLVLYTLFTISCTAQPDSTIADSSRIDTAVYLTEVRVNAYFGYQPLLNAAFTVNTVDSMLIYANHQQSLLPVLNLGPGIRMEERSPGSYRLSIRGSLLRSPFGVRNVKVYFDEFAFTDASGNTYLNLVDIGMINRLEILRGPDASLFGANTGGVLRLRMFDPGADTGYVQAGISAGSFGFFREHAQVRQLLGKHTLSIGQSWQRTDGYRENSSMDRKTAWLMHDWQYTDVTRTRLLALYSDLNYLTPGGLTQDQWLSDPRAARPATAFIPGAAEQKAGVRNKTFFAGLSHETKIARSFRHVAAFFGSVTAFQNPFLTNYEVREEYNAGVRTWLEYGSDPQKKWVMHAHIGFEGQWGKYGIDNYGNRNGQRDTLQASDDLDTRYGFGFIRVTLNYQRRLSAELSVSQNYNGYAYTSHYPHAIPEREKDFTPQLMPRVAVSYRIVDDLSWRIIVSKGYSPPTLAEIRSSDNIINTALEPEQGWNYEMGYRLHTFRSRLYIDLTGFYFALNRAIVRRTAESGAEYFTNAGETRQVGAELQFDIMAIADRPRGFIRNVKLCRSYTFSHFTFGRYSDGDGDYTGNFITGVPMHMAITGIEAGLAYDLFVLIQYQYTSRIPLNDANTVKSRPSHLLQAKITWTRKIFSHARISFFAGGDNLFNQLYSLGYDLNAFGGRYYNAAPARNFYGGFSVVF